MKKILCLSMCIISFGLSQPPGGPPADHKKARMIKKWKLVEYLDVSEEQSEKFFVKFNTFNKEMKALRKKNKKMREEIHDMLDENKVSKKKVDGLLDEYFDNESEILELRHKHHKEIGDVLTDEQTLKYMIFDHTFKKRIKDQLLEYRGHKGSGPSN